MASFLCERAISEAVRVGNAILKHISPNDVGATGGHQWGYYLPIRLWEMFTPYAPVKGQNNETEVRVLWQEEIETESRVKWYGRGTRREYRLTRFGRDFPFMAADTVGDLLVLIPERPDRFLAYVLDREEDIEDIQAALGLEIIDSWAAYKDGKPYVGEEAAAEDEDQCVEVRFRRFVAALNEFPPGRSFSEQTWRALEECVGAFGGLRSDDLLMKCMDAEYRLFRMAERQLCQQEIVRVFRDVDDFLGTAARIMNRRKARAGRSLENHVEYLLRRADIPHEMRPDVDGRPDIVIPGAAEYRDRRFPANRLIVIGVKTTCKDRWRQILNEAQRVREKHILTTQHGISANQLREMHRARVSLIVPAQLHREYPGGTRIRLFDVEAFIEWVRQRLW